MPGSANPVQRNVDQERKLILKIGFSVVAIGLFYLKNTFIGDDSKYQSDWHTVKNVTLLYPLLKPGDLIEYYRDFTEHTPKYSHWAVYVGTKKDENGTVQYRIVHFSTPPNISPIDIGIQLLTSMIYPKTYNISIREDNLLDPAHADLFRVNNARDIYWTPFEANEIVARARNSKTEPYAAGYSALTNNCEHFVNYCRYGKNESLQVAKMFINAVFTVFTKRKDEL